jgi:hypothetical protein
MRLLKYINILIAAAATILSLALVACNTNDTASFTGTAALKEGLTRLPDLHEQRAAHTATLLPGGKVLIAGGFRKSSNTYSQLYTNTAELYDPASGSFSLTGSMQIARCGQEATLLPGGDVLITGGNNDTPHLASAELYSSRTAAWTRLPDMLAGREGHRALLLTNGKVLIVGGSTNPDLYAELYDPATRTFEKAGAAPMALSGSTVVQLRDGRIFISGGWLQDRQPVQYSMLYDPATNLFTRGPDLDIVKYKAGAALLPDGKVLIIGGSNNRDWKGKYNSTEIYDPKTNSFTRGPGLHFGRFKLKNAVVTLRNGAIVVAGGNNHIEILTPADTAFRVTATLDQPYYFSTATLLTTGNVLLTGGYGNDVQCNGKSWLYDPAVTLH